MQTSVRSTPHGMILRVVVLALPVLLTFALTVLLIAVPLAWLSGRPLTDPHHLTLSVLCGLVAWLFLVIFHVRNETVVLPVHDRTAFFIHLVPVLEELGYEVKRQGHDRLVSRPTFRSMLVGGRLQVRVEGAEAKVVGPKVCVEIVRRRLRLRSVIARTYQLARDTRSRQGERLLKRVQISVRVPAAQWHGVGAEAVQALAGEGAEVLCELHIMAQSATGIREQTVEAEVRDRLRQQQLEVEIRKDFPQWEGAALNDHPPAAAAAVPV